MAASRHGARLIMKQHTMDPGRFRCCARLNHWVKHWVKSPGSRKTFHPSAPWRGISTRRTPLPALKSPFAISSSSFSHRYLLSGNYGNFLPRHRPGPAMRFPWHMKNWNRSWTSAGLTERSAAIQTQMKNPGQKGARGFPKPSVFTSPDRSLQAACRPCRVSHRPRAGRG